MRNSLSIGLILIATCAPPANSAPISVADPGNPWEVNHYINQVGQNSVGRFAGISFSFGLTNVVPNGKGEDAGTPVGVPTTGIAEQAGRTVTLRDTSTSVTPNGLSSGLAYNEANKLLTGEWTITLTNEADTLTVATPAICDSAADPDCAVKLLPNYATNVRLSDSTGALTPTFSWDLDEPVERISVSIYDLNKRDSQGRADRVFTQSLAAEATSFMIPEDWGLTSDGKYAFRIDTRILRTSGTNPSGSSQAGAALAETIAFYDFSPAGLPNGTDILLPVDSVTNPDGNPVFNFDNPVVARDVAYYDPIVAIGYDYAIGLGDPNFYSFILPNLGDGLFDLYLYDVTQSDWVFEAVVAADDEFFFAADGVDRFRILGIETGAGLDPDDPTAFVTGLSFVADGRFTGSMTPLTTFVADPAAVPLPASLGFLLGAMGIILLVRRGRRSVG